MLDLNHASSFSSSPFVSEYGNGPGRDDWIGDAARAAWADGAFQSIPSHVRFSHRDFGNGRHEVSVHRVYPDAFTEFSRLNWPASSARGEGDRAVNAVRAARRAKQRCRHVCKALGVNSLWTLTYRACVTDRDLVLRHLKEFIRRARRVLPDLRYVAVLELQARGSYHVHLATHTLPSRFLAGGVRVKSWDVMRRIWRSVVGDLLGTFNESRGKRWRGDSLARTCSGIARYISKYVSKSFELEADLNKKRFTCSEGVEVPRPTVLKFSAHVHMVELIELAYAAVGDKIGRAFYNAADGLFFIESDDSHPPPGGAFPPITPR